MNRSPSAGSASVTWAQLPSESTQHDSASGSRGSGKAALRANEGARRGSVPELPSEANQRLRETRELLSGAHNADGQGSGSNPAAFGRRGSSLNYDDAIALESSADPTELPAVTERYLELDLVLAICLPLLHEAIRKLENEENRGGGPLTADPSVLISPSASSTLRSRSETHSRATSLVPNRSSAGTSSASRPVASRAR